MHFRQWATQIIHNTRKFPSKNEALRAFDREPRKIRLLTANNHKAKKMTSDLSAIKPLLKATKSGSAADVRQEFKDQNGQHEPEECGIGIIPIGRFNHIKGPLGTLKMYALDIIKELEFGLLNGTFDGEFNTTRFWEKSNTLFRIQVEVLNWHRTANIAEDTITLERKQVSLTMHEQVMDETRVTQLKWEAGNTYYCFKTCKKRRQRKHCNFSAQLWAWNGSGCIHVKGKHQRGFETGVDLRRQ